MLRMGLSWKVDQLALLMMLANAMCENMWKQWHWGHEKSITGSKHSWKVLCRSAAAHISGPSLRNSKGKTSVAYDILQQIVCVCVSMVPQIMVTKCCKHMLRLPVQHFQCFPRALRVVLVLVQKALLGQQQASHEPVLLTIFRGCSCS